MIDIKDLQRVLAGLGSPESHTRDLPSGTPSTPYYTGPTGLFGVSGLEQDVISTSVRPRGLADMLPVRPNMLAYPLYPYLTGFLDASGSNPDGPCDDPPVAGPGKSCLQTAAFGRYSYQTREFEVNRQGLRIDRGEFTDLRLINNPILNPIDSITTPNVGGSVSFFNEMQMRMLETGISFQNKLTRQLYSGNPANNTNGGYAEFPGLDILVGTNKRDAITGTECPSLDSLIRDFNYAKVDAASGDTLLNVLTYMYRYFVDLAERTNLSPVEWVFVMKPALFYEVTAIWACAYLTYRCSFNSDDARVVVDGTEQVRMRDEMRNGRYLLIDGARVRVVLDDAIDMETAGDTNRISAGCFASDIYILPLTVRGGSYASLFWEHVDYNAGAMTAIEFARMGNYFSTDGGRFLWHAKPPNNWCVQLLAKIEPRIILRTPHLAGKLQNVQFCPYLMPREPFPDDPYFVNGGVSTPRSGPSYYSDWNP